MKNTCTYHHNDTNSFSFESEIETAHVLTVHSKRIRKPITSGEMWFIQKNYKRRAIGDQINYRF